jgi:hypothetical protein
MDQDSLNDLEAAMLKKRLEFLRAQGATGKPTHRLGDDFFKQMEDDWTFSSALSDIPAAKDGGSKNAKPKADPSTQQSRPDPFAADSD